VNRQPPARPFTVLLVCTGNICRSAMAERLGRAFLAQRLGDAAGAVQLVSAGTRAVVGSAMHPDSALVLQGYGAVPGDFSARRLDDRMAVDADLTLTMTRLHRREVLRSAPRALQRTFTLREAAELLRLLDHELDIPGEDLAERARDLVKELAAARSRRHNPADGDDVVDPIGQPVDVHEEVGEVIVAALLPVLERIAELHRYPAAVGGSGRVGGDAAGPTGSAS
jgi:protein-tyrosine phosphatase